MLQVLVDKNGLVKVSIFTHAKVCLRGAEVFLFEVLCITLVCGFVDVIMLYKIE